MGALGESLGGIRCPVCSGSMESGFILTKQSRPRWSPSRKGFTVFTGSPLTSLPRGFWLSRAAWVAPALEAARCQRCSIGVFRYDREPTPRRSGKRALALLVGAAVCAGLTVPVFIAALRMESPGFMFVAAALLLIGSLVLVVRSAVETI